MGQLADASGVSARSVRHYDERGLLPSRRSSNGYRLFGRDAVVAVTKVRLLLEAGYNLELIAQLLPCTSIAGEIDLCPVVADQMRAVLKRKQGELLRLGEQTRLIESHLNDPEPPTSPGGRTAEADPARRA